ncbi:MAG: hypothetical protein KAK04_19095 [Cyclobacteriaceae bacterium]|nr:hypothetical protein [Cyclobacteriaceae bacterium]
MSTVFKSSIIVPILILVVFIGQQVNPPEPTQKELQKLEEKWWTVKSWSASYNEDYHTEKTWELRPGVTIKTTVKSTISGTYTLDVIEPDGQSFGDWYGYGNGSSTMDQTVITKSEGPDGTITITEKTHTVSSGAIGIPSKNEYGEFWGGGLSIDIYNGTYSFGLGGPEADGKSTFTRTVEGLPTDYSDLEKLPEGMREIFVPLGDKAEEWANYSGPLEDAPGITVGGLAGFELFPDMDEPREYKLPKSGTQLKGSYSGKSITKSWTISPGGENELLVLEKAPKEWAPDPKTEKAATIKVTGDGLNGEKVKIRFTLYEVTKEKGICLNSQDDNTELDLQFDTGGGKTRFKEPVKTEDGWIIETSNKVMNVSIDVIPLDWGAWGKLKAEMEIDEGEWRMIYCKEGESYITIPLDERGGIENHIADQFEIDNGLTEGIQTMQDDEGSKNRGDGLTAYEEYRGFMIGGDYYGMHITTEPEKYMNLFVHPRDWQVMNIIDDGTVINNEIKINILLYDTDFVNQFERNINPNRGEWTVCKQHGLRLIHSNLDPFVLGETVGVEPFTPKDTEYCAIDINQLDTTNVLATTIHELMHGSGVDHHGKDNEDIPIPPDTTARSFALWNGINAGDITCVMQYGWGTYYKRKDGSIARDRSYNLIPFIRTENKIIFNNLCDSKVTNKHPQLGPAENGNCLNQVRVTDE